MKTDAHLRALVRQIRKANGSQSQSDFDRMDALKRSYMPQCSALDVDEAIKELEDWGTANAPKEISPELRLALIHFLKGKIGRKAGTKKGGSIMVAMAAGHARNLHNRSPKKTPMKKAMAEAAKQFGVTFAAIDALIYPRPRRRG